MKDSEWIKYNLAAILTDELLLHIGEDKEDIYAALAAEGFYWSGATLGWVQGTDPVEIEKLRQWNESQPIRYEGGDDGGAL